MDEHRIKHLELIQNIVSRLASNSFFLKGWTVTLVVGLFAFANTKDMNSAYALLAVVPTIFFWLLDGYFLRQERLFRKLYDKVRLEQTPTDFSMSIEPVKEKVGTWLTVCCSVTLLLFYASTLIVVILAGIILPKINF